MSGAHTPGPLKVVDREQGQFAIESDWSRIDGKWEDIYVCVSGYFGSYGPHMFAAAPELLEAVEAFIHYDSADDDDGVDMMLNYVHALDLAKAAVVKAKGGAA